MKSIFSTSGNSCLKWLNKGAGTTPTIQTKTSWTEIGFGLEIDIVKHDIVRNLDQKWQYVLQIPKTLHITVFSSPGKFVIVSVHFWNFFFWYSLPESNFNSYLTLLAFLVWMEWCSPQKSRNFFTVDNSNRKKIFFPQDDK